MNESKPLSIRKQSLGNHMDRSSSREPLLLLVVALVRYLVILWLRLLALRRLQLVQLVPVLVLGPVLPVLVVVVLALALAK